MRGDHDLSTVNSLTVTMAAAIASENSDVVVDLSGVTFIDGATIGVIVRARELLRLRARSLTLRAPSRSAKRVLDLCGIADS
jgi:anti-anti-sigma factor